MPKIKVCLCGRVKKEVPHCVRCGGGWARFQKRKSKKDENGNIIDRAFWCGHCGAEFYDSTPCGAPPKGGSSWHSAPAVVN